MATPTQYPLEYQTACNTEQNCGDAQCGAGSIRFNPRKQTFCDDVNMLTNMKVDGESTFQADATFETTAIIRGNYIEIGGVRYCAQQITSQSGSWSALVACG